MIVYFDALQALSRLTGLCELILSIEGHPDPTQGDPSHDDNAAAAAVPSGHVIGGDAGINGGISGGTSFQLEAATYTREGYLNHLSRLKHLNVGSHYLL